MHVIVSVVLNVWIRPWRNYCARCWAVSMRGSAGINAFLTSCSPVFPVGTTPPCGRVAPLHQNSVYINVQSCSGVSIIYHELVWPVLTVLWRLFVVYFNGNFPVSLCSAACSARPEIRELFLGSSPFI